MDATAAFEQAYTTYVERFRAFITAERSAHVRGAAEVKVELRASRDSRAPVNAPNVQLGLRQPSTSPSTRRRRR